MKHARAIAVARSAGFSPHEAVGLWSAALWLAAAAYLLATFVPY